VALLAAGVDRRRAADHLAEQVVERAQDLPGLGVVGAVHLLELLLVALGAVLGRDAS
jgi:acetoacetate decarboxylase